MAERTVAGSTTALVDLATGDWAPDLLDAVGVPAGLLPPIVEPGTAAGTTTGRAGAPSLRPRHGVGGRTAMGPAGGPSVGVRRLRHLDARRSGAAGAGQLAGGPRRQLHQRARCRGHDQFLKNVAGRWMLEQAKRSWPGETIRCCVEQAAHTSTAATKAVRRHRPRAARPRATWTPPVRRLAGIGAAAEPAKVVAQTIVESMARTAADVLNGLGGIERIDLSAAAPAARCWRRCRSARRAAGRSREHRGGRVGQRPGAEIALGLANRRRRRPAGALWPRR